MNRASLYLAFAVGLVLTVAGGGGLSVGVGADDALAAAALAHTETQPATDGRAESLPRVTSVEQRSD